MSVMKLLAVMGVFILRSRTATKIEYRTAFKGGFDGIVVGWLLYRSDRNCSRWSPLFIERSNGRMGVDSLVQGIGLD